MKTYKFNCTVWVTGEDAEQASKELHDEVNYWFAQDNNLIALESDDGSEEAEE
jgi:hypothetical protein